MATQRKRKATTKTRKAGKGKQERVILFPDEPSVIGFEKIRAAVDAVIAARTKGGKASS